MFCKELFSLQLFNFLNFLNFLKILGFKLSFFFIPKLTYFKNRDHEITYKNFDIFCVFLVVEQNI